MNMSDDAHFGHDVYPEPERTSLAAIFGFILSLGGCIAGLTAILGVPLSIMGIIASSRSRGRVGGKGFAVAGLIIGLLNLSLWGGCLGAAYFGTGAALTQFGGSTSRMLTSLQDADFDAARANLLAPAADAGDAEMLAFRAAYQASLGDFQSLPAGTIEYAKGFAELGPLMNSMSGQQNVFPFPATFDSGPALILIQFDPNASGINRITIIDLNGDEYTLPMPAGWDSQNTDTDTADTQPDTAPTEPGEEP